MKIKNLYSIVISCLIISAASCLSVKAYESSYNDEIKLGMDPGGKVFIIKKSGEKLEGRKITFSHYSTLKAVQKENWIAIDGVKVNREDIANYQSENGYYTFYKYNRHDEGQQYQMLARVRRGKLNLYYYTIHYTERVQGQDHNIYYIEKEKGKLQEFKFSEFYDIIKDNPKAVQKLNAVFPHGDISPNDKVTNLRKLASVVEVYNS